MADVIYGRRDEESSKAYTAFVFYCELGVGRSIDKAWEQYSKSTRVVPGYFRAWAADFGWVKRAAAYDEHIDTQARKQLERESIKRKADMLRRHALTGKVMQQKGVDYLTSKGIDRSSDAVAAISKGIDIERKSEGLPEWIFEVVNADDNELARQYAELYAQVSGNGSGDETAGNGDPGTASTPETPAES